MEANLVVKTNEVKMNTDIEVNITECTKSLGNKLFGAELQMTTENSSSFEDCNSGIENVDAFGDSEASSDFRGDADAPVLDFDGFGERFRLRRKKLTTHWRSFILPLMWRCKWVELQIKKLQSQAQLYDRELEVYDVKNQTQRDNSTIVDGTKSLAFSQKNTEMDVFRRKKRRRTEVTTDVAAYMLQHSLFSCYENKKCLTEAFMNNELKNPVNQKITTDLKILEDDELLPLDLGDGDNSIEHILVKIDFLQSEVGLLRSKFDRITMENAERISVAKKLDFPPPHSENGGEGTCMESQSTTAAVPQTGVTSYVDVPVTSGGIGPACFEAYKPMEDEVLIDNQTVKEEMNSFEEVKIQQMPLVLKDERDNTTPSVIAEPGAADDQPPAKVRSIAKITGTRSKRKRGRKKAVTSRWSRRSTG